MKAAAIKNMAWLIFDRLFKLIASITVGALVARHLGPDRFGALSLALSIVSVFAAVATFGLQSFVAAELAANADRTNRDTIGPALAIVTGMSVGASALLTVFSIGFMESNPDTAILLVILGASLLVRPAEVFRYQLESMLQTRVVIGIEVCSTLVCSILRIWAVKSNCDTGVFAVINLVEALIVASALVWWHVGKFGLSKIWPLALHELRRILVSCWPLAISALATILYMRLDQLMLGMIMGNGAVGQYTAAMRFVDVVAFVPIAIISSLYPQMARMRQDDAKHYLGFLATIYEIMWALGLLVSAGLYIFAEFLISFLYGSEYSAAITVLRVHAIGVVFMFLSVASGRALVVEGKHLQVLYRTVAVLALSVLVNYALIPMYGPVGAAISYVVSQAITGVLANIVFPGARYIFKSQIDALKFYKMRGKFILWTSTK